MKPRLWIVMMALAMLVACNGGREASVTGAYGQAVLAGEVSVAGGSPAGVEVSVRGTGMSMVVADDGQFAFANAPESAQLDFRRAADGIEASLRVGGMGFVSVELDRNNATAARKKSSKRRGVGGTRDVFEFEGVIRSADADSIVLFTSHKIEQEIVLGPETAIRKGQATLTPADLTVGTRVHVRAKKSEQTFTALLVIVQNTSGEDGGGQDAPAVREYEGTVRSATATTLVVFTSHRQEVTFTVNADTVIRKGNTPVAAGDIQAGWRVHVKATPNADGTATATRVTIQSTAAESVRLSGTVASVASSGLVVTTAGGSVTVRTTAATQIRKGGKKATLSSIVAGDKVEVEGTRIDATTVEAKKIDVRS